jgi:outer membrane protein assembly factor BamE (lipoprotein component of BamABCDE complex)
MRLLVAMLGVLLSFGCVTPRVSKDGIGRPPDAADLAASTIVTGKTTKREVLDRLGPPDQVMDGSQIPSARSATIWMYETVYVSEYGGDIGLLLVGGSSSTEITEKSYLIVYFDKRDIVTHFVSKSAGTNQATTPKKGVPASSRGPSSLPRASPTTDNGLTTPRAGR